MAEYVVGLEQLGATDLALAGGKGANLGELTRIGGVRVPPGFCVTTAAYAEAVGRDDGVAAALVELSGVDAGDADGIHAAGARVRQAIEAAPVPAAVADGISERLDEGGAYAVRSSATAEDLPTASFAGQQDTYLNVSGRDEVLRHVRRCWASLFTDRAIAYRLRAGVDHRGVQLAVVVQRMVLPEVAGTMFTADPITSDRATVSVDAGFGLGEALVSGLADADGYRVRGGRIVDRTVSAQKVAVRAAPGGGTAQEEVDPERRGAQKLPDAQILRLAALGRTIEAHFGRPQDIEWVFADGGFLVVQSRPITTLFPVPGPRDGRRHIYMSFGHQQMMTDAMAPLGLSFFQAQFEQTPLTEAGGRFYIDLAPDLASPVGRMIVRASMSRIDPLIDSALRGLARRKGFTTGLARGQRYLKMNTGYFSWRLPVEMVRLYLGDDPTRVPALVARHDEELAELRCRLAGRSGDELFDAVEDDLGHRLGATVTDPRSMAVVFVGLYALSWITKHVQKWLGTKGAGDALARLVADDVTVQMGLALLDVADAVQAHPAVLAALPTLPDATFFADLSALDGGDAVARPLRAFLDRYGARCSGEIDVTRPRWAEAPSTLVPLILSTARNLEPGARTARVEQTRREAEQMQEDLIRRLEALPGGRRKARRTRRMISRLRHFAGYREYPKYLMVRHYWVLKQALLGAAAELVEKGVIEHPDDVGFLTLVEFREAVRHAHVDRALIERRRAEHAAWTRLTPPRLITSEGEVPAGSYDRGRLPAGALPGIAASAGTAEGRARIVRDLADADLHEGDVLVTTFTDPSWTPLFLTATAVVTEVGGAMTHGAVVAREYGLPAVVGVEGATRLIRDGQRIRVDGTDGYVEICPGVSGGAG